MKNFQYLYTFFNENYQDFWIESCTFSKISSCKLYAYYLYYYLIWIIPFLECINLHYESKCYADISVHDNLFISQRFLCIFYKKRIIRKNVHIYIIIIIKSQLKNTQR